MRSGSICRIACRSDFLQDTSVRPDADDEERRLLEAPAVEAATVVDDDDSVS